MRSFFTLLIKHSCDQVKKNEMGSAGCMHERGIVGGAHIGVWFGNLSERGHFEHRHRLEDNIKVDLKINHLRERGRGSG
jgi:hypothetical protein